MVIVGLYPVSGASEGIDREATAPAWPSLTAYEDASLDEQHQLLPDREPYRFGDLTRFLGLFLPAFQCYLFHHHLILVVGLRLCLHSVSNA